MFSTLFSGINSLKSGLLRLTVQSNYQMGREAEDKDGIISEAQFSGTISVVRYIYDSAAADIKNRHGRHSHSRNNK
jgi:hypothetical protein